MSNIKNQNSVESTRVPIAEEAPAASEPIAESQHSNFQSDSGSSRDAIEGDYMQPAHIGSKTRLSQEVGKLLTGMRALAPGKTSTTIKPPTSSIFSKTRSLGRKKQSPTLNLTEEMEAALEASSDASKKDLHRARGVIDVCIGGSINVSSISDFAWIIKMIPDVGEHVRASTSKNHSGGESKSIVLATLSPSHLEKLTDHPDFRKLIITLSRPNTVDIFVKNDAGNHIDNSTKTSIRLKVLLQDNNGTAVRISPKKVSTTSAAAALALKCLAQEKYQLTAEIIAAAPDLIINSICTLPFPGNIFNDAALIAIINRLTPAMGKDVLQSQEMTIADQALGTCIKHYCMFPPLLDLAPAVNSFMSTIQPQISKQDLLLQNPNSFIKEVSHLIDLIISMPSANEPESTNPMDAKVAGWQAASLIGNAFKYINEAAIRLKVDQQDIAGYIKGACQVLQAATEAGSGFSGVFANAKSGAELAEQSIGTILARNAIKLNPEIDLNKLTLDMARLSDRLKELASQGFLAPGKRKISQKLLEEFKSDSDEKFVYLATGRDFGLAYGRHLQDFSSRELEREAKTQTDQVETGSK